MKIVVGFVIMVTCTVAANLLMKLGAGATPAPWAIFGVQWRTILGLLVFGFAGVIYAWLLRTVPLNLAQSFAAIQFIAVIVASYVFLAEPIAAPRWIGIAFIAFGILIVGLTANRGAASTDEGTAVGDALVSPSVARSLMVNARGQKREIVRK